MGHSSQGGHSAGHLGQGVNQSPKGFSGQWTYLGQWGRNFEQGWELFVEGGGNQGVWNQKWWEIMKDFLMIYCSLLIVVIMI